MTLKFCPLPPSIEAVQPSPAMAPYSLPKEDVKWPPTLQPPVVLAPPAPGPNLLVPAHGNAADFGEVFSEVLPSSHPQPGPLSTSLPPAAEQESLSLQTGKTRRFQGSIGVRKNPAVVGHTGPHGCELSSIYPSVWDQPACGLSVLHSPHHSLVGP